MKDFDGRSTVAEVALVFGFIVGVPVAWSLVIGHRFAGDFSQGRLLRTVAAEVVLALCFVPWLMRRRGWDPGRVASRPSVGDAGRGILLWVAGYAAYLTSVTACVVLWPQTLAQLRQFAPRSSAAVWVVILVSIINPVFEEFLFLGYAVPRLECFGLPVACLVSIALRTMLHAYQGLIAIVGILPLAIIFTLYYARTRRFWPVVTAHLIFDAVGLLSATHS